VSTLDVFRGLLPAVEPEGAGWTRELGEGVSPSQGHGLSCNE